MLGYKVLSTFK